MTTMTSHLDSTKHLHNKDGLQYRLLRVACYIFNIDLPDSPKQTLFSGVVRTLVLIGFVIASLVLLFHFDDFIIPYISAPIQTLMNHAADGPHMPVVAVQLEPRVIEGFLFCIWFAAIIWIIGMVQQRAFKHTSARLLFEREQAARQEAESALRLLKAQIEPHFLFNTLGAVQQLAENKAPEAAALTSDLILFLRATLNNLRADSTSLTEDLSICSAYLHIMETRLTRRLKFNINCPAALGDYRLPTTILLTLVENAIKHGIEPAPEGGHIHITVCRAEDKVIISVADTGAGFSDNIGQGLGLQNIRDRITLIYGNKASLRLEANEPCGVVASLVLPYAV